MRLYLLFQTEQFKFEDVIVFSNTIIFPFLMVDDQERHLFEEEPV